MQDSLNQLRHVRGVQDEVGRKTKDLEFEIGDLQQLSHKMDDVKHRVEESQQNIENRYISTTKKISSINDDLA